MKKQIPEAGLIPRFYGIAYKELWSSNVVCYPIPMNILVGLWVRSWRMFTIGLRPSRVDKIWTDGFSEGFKKGREWEKKEASDE